MPRHRKNGLPRGVKLMSLEEAARFLYGDLISSWAGSSRAREARAARRIIAGCFDYARNQDEELDYIAAIIVWNIPFYGRNHLASRWTRFEEMTSSWRVLAGATSIEPVSSTFSRRGERSKLVDLCVLAADVEKLQLSITSNPAFIDTWAQPKLPSTSAKSAAATSIDNWINLTTSPVRPLERPLFGSTEPKDKLFTSPGSARKPSRSKSSRGSTKPLATPSKPSIRKGEK